jgi:hypothetical protein
MSTSTGESVGSNVAASAPESVLDIDHRAGSAEIRIEAIELDWTIQSRSSLREDVVEDYAERLHAGEVFPPVVVFQQDHRYYIGDGWHRIHAVQKNGGTSVRAVVHPGGRAAALLFALGANSQHGLMRTSADKRHAAAVALREFQNRSDRELAKLCAVSDKTVASVRNCGNSAVATVTSRLGADGKTRRLPYPTARSNQTPVDQVNPTAALPQIEAAVPDDPVRAVLYHQLEHIYDHTPEIERARVRSLLVETWDKVTEDDAAQHALDSQEASQRSGQI